MNTPNMTFSEKLIKELDEILRYHYSIFGVNNNISETLYLEVKQEMFTMINLFSLLDSSFEDELMKLLLKDILSLTLYFDKLSDNIKAHQEQDIVKEFKRIKSEIIPVINTKMYYLDLYVFYKVSQSRFLESYIRQRHNYKITNTIEFIAFSEDNLTTTIDTNYKVLEVNLFSKYTQKQINTINNLNCFDDRREDHILRKLIDSRRAISFFKDMDPEDIKYVVKDVEFIKYNKNEVIIQKNEDTKQVYFLLSGKCDVILDGTVVGKVSSNQIFGEFSSILNEKRNATIMANESTTVLRFNLAFELFKKEPYTFTWLYKNIMDELIKKIVRLNNNR